MEYLKSIDLGLEYLVKLLHYISLRNNNQNYSHNLVSIFEYMLDKRKTDNNRVKETKLIIDCALQNHNVKTIESYLEAFHGNKKELMAHLSGVKILFYDVEMLLHVIHNVKGFDISDYEEFIYVDYMKIYVECVKNSINK